MPKIAPKRTTKTDKQSETKPASKATTHAEPMTARQPTAPQDTATRTASGVHVNNPNPDPELIKAAGPAPAQPMPEQSEMTIEQLLADPRFDPEGHVRDRLAEISAKGPLGQRPPADLVNAAGHVVAPPQETRRAGE